MDFILIINNGYKVILKKDLSPDLNGNQLFAAALLGIKKKSVLFGIDKGFGDHQWKAGFRGIHDFFITHLPF